MDMVACESIFKMWQEVKWKGRKWQVRGWISHVSEKENHPFWYALWDWKNPKSSITFVKEIEFKSTKEYKLNR